MNIIDQNQLINLYIDESGSAYLGEPRYRFYVVSGVIMYQNEVQLANNLFEMWRRKYLLDPSKSFHAVDFFEDFKEKGTEKYKKTFLRINKRFEEATNELTQIISNLKFSARIFYVDLPKLRYKFAISKFPKKRTKKNKNDYQKQIIIQTAGNPYLPLNPTLESAFEFHAKKLAGDEKCGYVSFESQRDFDEQTLTVFHNFQKKINGNNNNSYKYGNDILGINLLTKPSLASGIELADLIAYLNCQTLRGIYAKNELNKIRDERLVLIRKMQLCLNRKFKIQRINVTDKSEIIKTKKASMLLACLGEAP